MQSLAHSDPVECLQVLAVATHNHYKRILQRKKQQQAQQQAALEAAFAAQQEQYTFGKARHEMHY